MQRIKASLLTMIIAFGVIGGIVLPPTAFAAPSDVIWESCDRAESARSPLCSNPGNQKLFGPNSIWTNIINTLIFIVGAVAVVMIVIGGLRYTISNGDQSQVTSAKNTILYAVVGIVVAASSYAIVNFVLTRI